MECGLWEKAQSSGGQGEHPLPRTQPQGTCEPGLISQGWGTLPQGRLLVGGPALPLRLPVPASWPETSQPSLRQKPSTRGPPLWMEEQEDLRSGKDGTEGSAGFPKLRPLTPTLAPGLRAPWRQWAAYRGIPVSCGVHGTAWALSRRERTPGPRESLRESPSPGPSDCCCLPGLLPWGLVPLAWAQVHCR